MAPSNVAVIGAGPVGCLTALSFAQRGASVTLYDGRPDPRQWRPAADDHRSINLAISTRGLTALASVGVVSQEFLDDMGDATPVVGGSSRSAQQPHTPPSNLAEVVLRHAVPMRGRMIHLPLDQREEGTKRKGAAQVGLASQEYSPNGDCINSVDRGKLNVLLLNQAQAHPLIRLRFGHRLRKADYDAGERTAKLEGEEDDSVSGLVTMEFDVRDKGSHTQVTEVADFVAGCDGLNSAVRRELARYVRLDFSREYIDSGYLELSIPASRTPETAPYGAWGSLSPSHLHIWPRHEFMLIALPNQDGSFTCTLFVPFTMSERRLSDADGVLDFFRTHFPDALPLIGEKALVRDVLDRALQPLACIKCDPYHYKDRVILLGDAAHAMVPFYGQGLNCGFEDVRVLFEMLDEAEDRTRAEMDGLVSPRTPEEEEVERLRPLTFSEFAISATKERLDSGVRGLDSPLQPPTGLGLQASDSSALSSPRSLSPASTPLMTSASLTSRSRSLALARYSSTRRADLHAIAALALANYVEMSSRVVSRSYLLRKKLDGALMRILPKGRWESLYSMVTFSNEGYAKAKRREERQKSAVETGIWTTGIGIGLAVGLGLWRATRWGQ